MKNVNSQLQRVRSLLEERYPHWRCQVFEEIDSTSDEARRQVQEGVGPAPFVLLASHQTGGRGRQGRRWVVPPGKGLLFTAAAPMHMLGASNSGFGRAQKNFPRTLWPLQIGLTLALRMRSLGWRADLKWPNDVVIEGRKVGGILCEVSGGWFLAGVGINLLQTEEDLMEVPDPRLRPSSLLLAPHRHPYRIAPEDGVPSFVQSVLAVLESPWPQERVLRYYEDWCVTLGTKVATVDDRGEAVSGVASGIEPDGSLVVELLGGRHVRVTNEIMEVAKP